MYRLKPPSNFEETLTLKMLTIFTKRLILDAWLGPESVPVD